MELYLHSPYAFTAWCLIKHRDNTTCSVRLTCKIRTIENHTTESHCSCNFVGKTVGRSRIASQKTRGPTWPPSAWGVMSTFLLGDRQEQREPETAKLLRNRHSNTVLSECWLTSLHASAPLYNLLFNKQSDLFVSSMPVVCLRLVKCAISMIWTLYRTSPFK